MKNIKILFFASLILGLAFIAGSCNNAEKAPMKAKLIPLEDFFKNPEKSSYQISPDGKYFSFKAPYESRLNIFIQERGKDEAVRLTSETDRDISGYFWPNNEQILYLKDDGGNENFKLYGVNIDGTNPVCFTDFEDVRTTIIDDLPDIPGEVIISGEGVREYTVPAIDNKRIQRVAAEIVAETAVLLFSREGVAAVFESHLFFR